MTIDEILSALDFIADDLSSNKQPEAGRYIDCAAALIRRWRDGKFTPEEIHNFCHNLHGTVTAEEFAKACIEEQRKLYGYAPCERHV